MYLSHLTQQGSVVDKKNFTSLISQTSAKRWIHLLNVENFGKIEKHFMASLSPR